MRLSLGKTMRHRKAGRKLNRNSSHRRAMFSNMIISLLRHELIKTTVAKAKELRRFAEPMITLGKIDSVANRRRAFAKLRDKAMVAKLFTEIGPRFQQRPGGYLRIVRCGFRHGDAAPLAIVELVERGAAPQLAPVAEQVELGSEPEANNDDAS